MSGAAAAAVNQPPHKPIGRAGNRVAPGVTQVESSISEARMTANRGPLKPAIEPEPVRLDDMLDADGAARWMHIKRWDLNDKSRSDDIPTFKLSYKIKRYHPRTILAVLARRAGVPLDLIAASFGEAPKK